MSVKTDPYATLQECEAKAPEAVQSGVDQYVDKSPRLRQKGHVQLLPEQLRQLVVADASELWQSPSLPEPMHRVHFLLKFDEKAKQFIEDAQNDRVFMSRASVTAALATLTIAWTIIAVLRALA